MFPSLQVLLPWIHPLTGPVRCSSPLEVSGALEYLDWLHADLSPPEPPKARGVPRCESPSHTRATSSTSLVLSGNPWVSELRPPELSAHQTPPGDGGGGVGVIGGSRTRHGQARGCSPALTLCPVPCRSLALGQQYSSLGSQPILCGSIPGLVPKQLRFCRNYIEIMPSVAEGVKLGIQECQHQFRGRRWNCTTIDDSLAIFGPVLDKGNPWGQLGWGAELAQPHWALDTPGRSHWEHVRKRV